MSQAELERASAETTLGSPIALLAVGGGLFVVGGGFLIDGLVWRSSWYTNNTDCSYCDDLSTPFLITGGAMMGIGAPLAIAGGIWLGNRLGDRRAINRELNARKKTAQIDAIRYGVVPLRGGLGLAVSGTLY